MNRIYSIKDGDSFHPNDYPQVIIELAWMKRDLLSLHSPSKGEIIISYFKDHCIRCEWIADYPQLTARIRSRDFQAVHLEALLDSCLTNKTFCWGLENHIKMFFLTRS